MTIKRFETFFGTTTVKAAVFELNTEEQGWPLDIQIANDENDELVAPLTLTREEGKDLYLFLKDFYEPKLDND